jgi:hypothetical protein
MDWDLWHTEIEACSKRYRHVECHVETTACHLRWVLANWTKDTLTKVSSFHYKIMLLPPVVSGDRSGTGRMLALYRESLELKTYKGRS